MVLKKYNRCGTHRIYACGLQRMPTGVLWGLKQEAANF